jgi:hypothetical protein
MNIININHTEFRLNGQEQVYSNGKIAVAMTQMPEEYDTIYWGDYMEEITLDDINSKDSKLSSEKVFEFSKKFTDPKLIKTIIEYKSLSTEEKEKLYLKINYINYKKSANDNPIILERYDMIIKTQHNLTEEQLSEIKTLTLDEEEAMPYYLGNGFDYLDVVWIESNNYIQIYNDYSDYIQRYNISKKYKKGYFKLFDL